ESKEKISNYYETIYLNDGNFQPTGNLTDDFASYTALQIVKLNPGGPQIDENGNQNINIPNIEKITDDLSLKLAEQINLSSWDEEFNKAISKTEFIDQKSIDDLVNYLNNFNKLTENNLENNNLMNLFDLKNPYNLNPEIISNITETNISNIINEMSKIKKLPKELENFHNNFIKLLVYQKNILKSYQKINNDPLYTIYVSQAKESDIINMSANLKNEAQKIAENIQSYSLDIKNKNLLGNFQNIFQIRKANAFIVHDPGNAAINAVTKAASWGSFTQQLFQWGRKIATEILKDQLIHRLVNQVVIWIQGGGNPRFITNWKNFLSEAFNLGFQRSLRNINMVICPPFKNLINTAFGNVNNNINQIQQGLPDELYKRKIGCTLGTFVNNLKNFSENFNNGGWENYAAVLEPQNNFFGAFIIARDLAIQEASQEKESQKSDAESSRGFLSTKVCVKRVGAICEQYQTKTPGALIADITGQSISMGPISRIANAQDITALVSALINSALNKLIKAGSSGIIGALNVNTNQLEPGAVSDLNNACYGLLPGTDEYNECQNNNIYKNSPSQITNIIQQARALLDQLNQAYKADQEWLKLFEQIKNDLDVIGGCSGQTPFCQNISNQACQLISNLESIKTKINNEEISKLQLSIEDISSIISELDKNYNNISIERLNEINEKLSQYNDISILKPQQRLTDLQQLKEIINQNLNQDPTCNTDLPNL
ncbi:MAG: hypothetical protein N2Z85_00770, partial [Patescibacteria group bacterium]|nr:hypothetical protein [Patescibacteria group bacterium]